MGEDLGNLADLLGDNAVPIGFVAYIKALDENGDVFWALRTHGMNDMEMLGCADMMVQSMREDLASSTYTVEDGDDG